MPTKTATKTTSKAAKAAGLRLGFRSGLEDQIAEELAEAGVPVEYEKTRVPYTVPAREAKYAPDFRLPDGSFVETKGRFVTADRKKHLLIKDQHPGVKIRFLFSNPNQRIGKGSPTTYAMWCEKNGFEYAKAVTPTQRKKGARSIPEEWLKK